MSLDDLNREQKRMLKRQGALDEQGKPTRAVRQSKSERVGPVQYLREVRDEMRKVAWPQRPEVIRYSIIVTVCVIVYMIFVGVIDYGLAQRQASSLDTVEARALRIARTEATAAFKVTFVRRPTSFEIPEIKEIQFAGSRDGHKVP